MSKEKQNIKSNDWLTVGYSEEEIAKMKAEAIKEAENELREKQIEEMAKIFCGMKNGCDGCMWYKVHCNERNYAEEIYNAGYRKMPDNIGDFSDGYHTFNELYHHRAVLFSVICNMFSEKAWKSKLHDTGDMYDGMFIVGIETEQGQATYHYDIEPYWDMFKVKELEKAPKYDGHTPSDAIARIGNLPCEGYRKQSENVIELPCKVGDTVYCIERKNIHECLVTMVKSLTYEGATRFFVETECEIVSPFYSDGRKIKHGIMAVWEIEWGSWYRAFRTREEAEEALAKMKGGAE